MKKIGKIVSQNIEEIVKLHWEGKNLDEIAEMYNTERHTISKYIKKSGLADRGRQQLVGKNSKIWKGYGGIGSRRFSLTKNAANKRNLEFSVDIQYIWNLFLSQNKKCALTGIDLILEDDKYGCFTFETTASLDRIDSKKGYIEGNLQWVHKDINFIKGNMSTDEFVEKCREIISGL